MLRGRDKFLVKRYNKTNNTSYTGCTWIKEDESDTMVHLPVLYGWVNGGVSIKDNIDILATISDEKLDSDAVDFVDVFLTSLVERDSPSFNRYDLGCGVYGDIMNITHYWRHNVGSELYLKMSGLVVMFSGRDAIIHNNNPDIEPPDPLRLSYIGCNKSMEYTAVNHEILRYISYMDMIYGEHATKHFMISEHDHIYSKMTEFFYTNRKIIEYDFGKDNKPESNR